MKKPGVAGQEAGCKKYFSSCDRLILKGCDHMIQEIFREKEITITTDGDRLTLKVTNTVKYERSIKSFDNYYDYPDTTDGRTAAISEARRWLKRRKKDDTADDGYRLPI